ncbi:MAG: alpha/beta hydrolase [Betaproteobacteria bacterium]|nr:alpha/beta hydrolase [Betaproteobacteria bacterium]
MKIQGQPGQASHSLGSGPPCASNYLRCGKHEIHYLEWGFSDRFPIIMWHGLARTGRDFDVIAGRLSESFRVICPDTIGRGLSQWSSEPARDYCMEAYAELAVQLVEGLGLRRLHWIGTSMGGAIGLRAAAGPLRERIATLVLNDIGPTLPRVALERIRDYVGRPPSFATVAELEAWMRQAYLPFGWQSDAQWRSMAEHSLRRLPDGRLTLHYDPAIASQLSSRPRDYEQWEAYDSLTLPVLLLRGADSDLLPPEIAEAMSCRGPRARRVDFAGCGHAPALNVDDQIHEIEGFLHSQGTQGFTQTIRRQDP